MPWLAAVLLLSTAAGARAQWITQSIDLKPGWNAVFLHVNASHDTLDALVGDDAANPILEIWRWNPPSVAQFTDSPALPAAAPEWASWVRANRDSALQRLSGDSAYLVRVGTNVPVYTWKIKGRPVAPRSDWTISGLNLIGFSTPTNNPPKFDAFLAQASEFQLAIPEIYPYQGGDLGPSNPALLPPLLFHNTPVRRGQAFWVRSGTVFNRYFGPFEVVQSGANGVDFRENLSSATFRLRNLTANSLTVALRLIPSETPPVGQSNVVALPPLLVRGGLNTTNLTYGYASLPAGSPHTWTLAARDLPGSEIEVVLGLNRTTVTAAPGALLAGVLRFTDSLGHSQVDVPVSATAASSAGLWVGSAAVTRVGHYLKSYQRAPDNTLVTTTNGNYVVTNIDTSLGAVARPYPLRLIVHNPATGSNAVLLQRVYYGLDSSSNAVVASGESALHPAHLKDARRITSTQLPWTATNTAWPLNGKLRQQTTLTTTMALAYDDQASNPFLHTYHPDHDNLDATFKTVLAQGSESYAVQRAVTLTVKPPGDDFSSLVAGGDTVTGDYQETITFQGLARAGGTHETREFQVRGAFRLNRVSDIPTLTLAP